MSIESTLHILQELNTFISIVWTYMRPVDLMMVSMDPLSTFLQPNMSPHIHQIDLLKELALVNIWQRDCSATR